MWAPDYLTTSELKGWLRIGDTVDDLELAGAVAAASRAVDRCCGRQFGHTDGTEEREYEARWDQRRRAWLVDIDDLDPTVYPSETLYPSEELFTEDLAIAVGGTSVTSYTFEPRNATKKGLAYTRIVLPSGPTGVRPWVSVTARWGWSTPPATVVQATKLQASRFMARRDSPFGIAGSPDQGSELRLLAKVDPDVQLMLAGYRRGPVVA